MIRSRAVPLVLAFGLLAAAALPVAAQSGRVVAIGDIHGAYDPLASILRTARLIDGDGRWIGGDSVLVQVGDFLDRGSEVFEVMDLLMRLQAEAPRHGGDVIVVLGNHEAMNLLGVLRDVSPETYAGLVTPESVARREALLEAAGELYLRTHDGELPPDFEESWREKHPPGYLEYRELLSPEGRYGGWLRTLPIAVKLGDTFFIHAGVSPDMKFRDAETLTATVYEDLDALDRYRKLLADHGLILPVTDYRGLVATAGILATNRFGRRAYGDPARAGAAAFEFDDATRREIRKASKAFLNRREDWTLTDLYGPLWFRGFTKWGKREGARNVKTLRRVLGVEHFVAGHTPVRDRSIHQRFEGAVFLTDTGMLSAHYQGGRPAVLERSDERWSALYLDRREWLAGPRLAGWRGSDGELLPWQSDDEVLDFLTTAEVVSSTVVTGGTSRTLKLLLEKDGARAHAAFRTVDLRKERVDLGGKVIFGFHDSYRYEVAAYELSRLLDLDSIPPVVMREIDGEQGSLQLWMEKTMTERDRRLTETTPPDSSQWYGQLQAMRIFDRLIYNFDRNLGNILIDDDWKVWMIDHTRSFRLSNDVPEIKTVTQCERDLWLQLKELDGDEVRDRLEPYVSAKHVRMLMKRRDKVLERIEWLIGEYGEDAVIFSIEEPTRNEIRLMADLETFLQDLPDSSAVPAELRTETTSQ